MPRLAFALKALVENKKVLNALYNLVPRTHGFHDTPTASTSLTVTPASSRQYLTALAGKPIWCFILVNLSSSAAAITLPSITMAAEASCILFIPSTITEVRLPIQYHHQLLFPFPSVWLALPLQVSQIHLHFYPLAEIFFPPFLQPFFLKMRQPHPWIIFRPYLRLRLRISVITLLPEQHPCK